MQVFSVTYLKSIMEREDKRIDSLICSENIPHETYSDVSFEENLDYEVLGINWVNESFVVMNDWGEVEEIPIGDPRFKIDNYIPNKQYPTNFLLGVGMNQKNQWRWFK
ncbi:hypothetical protein ACFC4S_26965 [Priestia megaterium]|uniref:hypothetical protein n=1 Tax=Priestia megaterium TaxID=1404 RepID=UPI001DE94299|nr:hypothetical protein [Priestia megaterium]